MHGSAGFMELDMHSLWALLCIRPRPAILMVTVTYPRVYLGEARHPQGRGLLLGGGSCPAHVSPSPQHAGTSPPGRRGRLTRYRGRRSARRTGPPTAPNRDSRTPGCGSRLRRCGPKYFRTEPDANGGRLMRSTMQAMIWPSATGCGTPWRAGRSSPRASSWREDRRRARQPARWLTLNSRYFGVI